MNYYIFADNTTVEAEGGIPHEELMELIKVHGKCKEIVPESMYVKQESVA